MLLAGFIPQAAHALDRLIPGDRHAKRTSPLEGSALVSTSEMGLYQARENLALCMKRGGELTAREDLLRRSQCGQRTGIVPAGPPTLGRGTNRIQANSNNSSHWLTQQELSQEGRLLVQAMNQLLTQLRAATWLSVTAAQVIRRKKSATSGSPNRCREDLGVYFSIIQEAYFITHNNLTSDREGLPQREIAASGCRPSSRNSPYRSKRNTSTRTTNKRPTTRRP
ncbi:MAG: hypothetical protein ACLR8Y_07150 [Alistipes indistinctus]